MKIYNLHPHTGEHLGDGVADESPLEPGVFIIPGSSTTEAPPSVGKDECAVFVDGEWSVKKDLRGYRYWDADGKFSMITDIGEEPPAVHSTEKPAPTVSEVSAARAVAYSDPITGCDKLFAKASRMQVMGEDGFESAREVAIARYEEINTQHPWPAE